MLTALHRSLHVVLNRPRIFALTGGTLLIEILVRAALATFHPVLSVVWPPIICLLVFGVIAPTVRAAVDNPNTAPEWDISTKLHESSQRLCALAFGGHLIALALGTSLFLIADTILRAAIYATGGTVPTVVVYLSPLIGVAAGAFIIWALITPAVAHVVAGNKLPDASLVAINTLALLKSYQIDTNAC